jgi:hypothetical protein
VWQRIEDMPRSKRKLTDEQLKMCHKMAALNMPFEYMAALLGIQYDSFILLIKTNKLLRTTIQQGRAATNNNVRVTILEKAMGKPPVTDADGKILIPAIEPDFAAMKYWSETQEGFKKTTIMEVPGLTQEDTIGLGNDDIDSRAEILLEKIRARKAARKGR